MFVQLRAKMSGILSVNRLQLIWQTALSAIVQEWQLSLTKNRHTSATARESQYKCKQTRTTGSMHHQLLCKSLLITHTTIAIHFTISTNHSKYISKHQTEIILIMDLKYTYTNNRHQQNGDLQRKSYTRNKIGRSRHTSKIWQILSSLHSTFLSNTSTYLQWYQYS